MNTRSRLPRLWALVSMVLAVATLAACNNSPPPFKNIDITGADYAKDFQLTDQHGQRRRLQDFKGKVVVVFFGYTQCPDVCPTSMLELAQVKRTLGPVGDKLQSVFISLDPERDTRAVLQAYMANFDATFLALRPELTELPAVTQEFKIYYKKVAGSTPTSYTLDHTAGSYVFDTTGRVRLYSRYGSGAPNLATDISLLLKEAR